MILVKHICGYMHAYRHITCLCETDAGEIFVRKTSKRQQKHEKASAPLWHRAAPTLSPSPPSLSLFS